MKSPPRCRVPVPVRQPRGLRGRRERVIQTLCFEALGLVIVSPLLAHFAGASAGESVGALAVLSIAVMGWSAVFNTAFDWIEWRWTGRAASDRPHGLRLGHALGHELTATLVSWPLIVALTTLGWLDALLPDFGLTLGHALYGHGFHLAFDRLRPVRNAGSVDR